MTKARHVLNRTNVCHGLCALALLGLSLVANASTYPNGNRANGQSVWNQATNGKSTTVNGQGSGSGSRPTAVSGNADVLDASGNVVVNGGATVNVNGSNVAVQATGKISKGDIAAAAVSALACSAGGVAGAVVCGGVALALPIAMNWMSNAGVRVNPTTKELEKSNSTDPGICTVAPCYTYRAWNPNTGATIGYMNSGQAACAASWPYVITWMAGRVTGSPKFEPTVSGGDVCGGVWDGTYVACCIFRVAKGGTRPPDTISWTGASVGDATGLMNNSRIPSADIVRELESAGQTPAMPIKDVTVTGPASVQGPTTTNVTNNSTTNTTTNTTTTTNNYTYNTNTVTNNSSSRVTTTSTAVKNPDGTTTTTPGPTTTDTTSGGEPAKPEEPPVQCDKYPNSLGCAELDTPTAQIPRETKTITFQAEDMLGGGQCPADVMTTLNTLGGRSVKVVDWQTFCGMAVPLRALVMGLAAIMAFFIIMPGGVRE